MKLVTISKRAEGEGEVSNADRDSRKYRRKYRLSLFTRIILAGDISFRCVSTLGKITPVPFSLSLSPSFINVDMGLDSLCVIDNLISSFMWRMEIEMFFKKVVESKILLAYLERYLQLRIIVIVP